MLAPLEYADASAALRSERVTLRDRHLTTRSAPRYEIGISRPLPVSAAASELVAEPAFEDAAEPVADATPPLRPPEAVPEATAEPDASLLSCRREERG